jgi:long-chain fatty acid transport protein
MMIQPKRAHWIEILAAGLVLFSVSSPARAGGIEYLSNQSADYIRTFSRNAATDSPDAVSYNPAGTAWLKDGVHLSLSSQTLLGQYAIDYDGKTYTADVAVPSLPALHAVFKRGELAVFGAFTIPAGGGALTYNDGLPYLIPLITFVKDPTGPTPKDGVFSGSSIFYGVTVGAAYRLFGKLSVAVAGRAVLADKAFSGHATYGDVKAELDTTKQAMGFAPILGLTIKPGFGVTLAARYEGAAAMEFTAKTKTVNMKGAADWQGTALESFVDGAKEQRDMPATLGLGAAWTGKGITVSTSFHAYMTKAADSAKDYAGVPGTGGLGAYSKSWDDDYEDGWDVALAVEYQVTDALLLSTGAVRASLGGSKDTLNDFEQALDSDSVCGGVRYTLNKRLKLTAAVSRTFYKDDSNEALVPLVYPSPETYRKRVFDLAVGVQYSF